MQKCCHLNLQKCDTEKWKNLANQFKNIVKITDWNKYINSLDLFKYNYEELKSQYDKKNFLEFWSSLDPTEYPHLKALALGVLSLPYSSASVERTFSVLRDAKDSKRNRMCPSILEACLLIHHELGNIENFELTGEMLHYYAKMWNQPVSNKPNEEAKLNTEQVTEGPNSSKKRKSEIELDTSSNGYNQKQVKVTDEEKSSTEEKIKVDLELEKKGSNLGEKS